MRAFDAAVYLIGKDPYYHIYPVNYFPKRHSVSNFQKLKTTVQAEAKKYSEKGGSLPVNPLSLVSETSKRAPQGLTISELVEPARADRQVISPMEGNSTNIPEEEEVNANPAEEEEFEEVSHPSPYHDHYPSTDSWPDFEVKVPEAYLRGLNAPNPGVVDNALLDYSPAESFNVFPYIQGVIYNSILDVFAEDPSLKLVPFKRERESDSDALEDHFDGSPASWSAFPEVPHDYLTGAEAYDYDHPMPDLCESGYFV